MTVRDTLPFEREGRLPAPALDDPGARPPGEVAPKIHVALERKSKVSAPVTPPHQLRKTNSKAPMNRHGGPGLLKYQKRVPEGSVAESYLPRNRVQGGRFIYAPISLALDWLSGPWNPVFFTFCNSRSL